MQLRKIISMGTGTGTEEKKQVISNRDVDEKQEEEEEEEGMPLPGFRFHPTDEELVGFYLHRKVHKKPITIELIKQIDIYKYDPWDLPKIGVGEKEWYFYCKRGRKYRNSIRPNRVTGCGFWKATGIDRPIYNSAAACIGLKKSLVFYRGTAGKGTKTDWMMHEFRLPPQPLINNTPLPQQPAEVWTLCRIVKRNGCQKKTLPDWREITANSNNYAATKRNNKSKRCSSSSSDEIMQSYISFQAATAPLNIQQIYTTRPSHGGDDAMMKVTAAPSTESTSPLISSGCSSFSDVNEEVLLKHGNWDDLRSVVQFANATSHPIFFM